MKSALIYPWPANLDDLMRSSSAKMRSTLDQVRSVADTRTTVLLTGETGTGKGLVARLIHHLSTRQAEGFVSVHCGAIPDTLLESELFGHEKGAFTGAIRRRKGKFEQAHGGTLFLDEIGTISPLAQVKLLQVLQERVFQRVGGEDSIEADVRVVTATNSNLDAMRQAGTFREDLYYRLCVFPIAVPPLRERIEDLPRLVRLVVSRLDRLYAKKISDVESGVLEALCRYDWPGNIRELENVLERAFILEKSGTLRSASFPAELIEAGGATTRIPLDTGMTLDEVRRVALESAERGYLASLLERHEGKIAETAEAAGIGSRQLHKLMTRHGLRKEDFKRRPSA
ncbi:MAG: sigma-54 dependent transcriptional regulator [Acidobacteriota bacterium]|nr:sigma-54 dependent transcriptional regulator [Acidobacteriota bacterium]